MNAYNASPGIKWISYMIINFDDSSHEYCCRG
jgi:hypothetical protein